MTFWMKVCKFRANSYLKKLTRAYSQILFLDSMFDKLTSDSIVNKPYNLTDSKEIIIIANKVMSYIELVEDKYEQLQKSNYKHIMSDCYCIACNNFDHMIKLFKNDYKNVSIKDIFDVQFKDYKSYRG